MADSREIEKALIARLSGDAQLAAILPDGVHVHQAKQGAKFFALISLVVGTDAGHFASVGQRRASEDCLYMVKAVTLDASRTRAGDGAARIDALLEDQPLTISGYLCASIARDERIDETEVDDLDATIRWQHRGGRYRILAVPI